MSFQPGTHDAHRATQILKCEIDGTIWTWLVDARETLAEVLNRTGIVVNMGCDQGQCGACLVEVDGAPIQSCLILAIQCAGAIIRTARFNDVDLNRVRQWMSACSALQCGYCAPAFAMCIIDLARHSPSNLNESSIRVAYSDVTCRCTGYQGLVEAGAGVLSGEPAPKHIPRREDERLLSGAGRFVGGQSLPNQAWARVVRSTLPHADIITIETGAALATPGVVAVFTANDLPETIHSLHDGLVGPAEPLLAAKEVRYVGQPVAVVIADTPAAAMDGAELVVAEYRERPPLPGPEEMDSIPSDDDPRWLPPLSQSVGTAGGEPSVVVSRRFALARQTGMPIETRALLADWDGDAGLLTVYGVTKHPDANRGLVARALGLATEQVRMPAADVGGSFGIKGELYPEDLVIPWVSLRLGRPVKWTEDRAEHLVSANHSRGQVWHVRMSADRNGRLLEAQVRIDADAGAYVRPLTTLVPYLASAMFPGPYRLPCYHAEVRCLLTSRTPIGTMRAPGRVEANFVRERMLDMLAAQLDMDRVSIRRCNLLTAVDMPYDTGTVNEGAVRYDDGDFLAAYDDVVSRVAATAPIDDGLRRATAVVPFVEKAGFAATEVAVATLRQDKSVRIDVACASSGQSHETTLSTIATTVLGIPTDQIEVVFGDPASAARSLGTYASRTIMYTGNAVHLAACQLRDNILARAAGGESTIGWLLDWPVIQNSSGQVVARIASLLAAHGTSIAACAEYNSDLHTYPYGTVTCGVAVDPELFTVQVERLAISCDAGRPINRDVVVGQLRGGMVQGVGGALLEEICYDRAGHPATTGLDHYLLPHADDVPNIEVRLLESTLTTEAGADNPLGVKGIGEAGIAAVAAAMASAVCAAIPELNQRVTDLPLDPSRLWAVFDAVPGTINGCSHRESSTGQKRR